MKHTLFISGLYICTTLLMHGSAAENLRAIALKHIIGNELTIQHLIDTLEHNKKLKLLEIARVATITRDQVTIHTANFDVLLPTEEYATLIKNDPNKPLQLTKKIRDPLLKGRSQSQ